MPNWEMIGALATGEVGQLVKAGPLPAAYRGLAAGLAGWDGANYRVALDEDLSGEALLRVLYHELGHLTLGHVVKVARPWSEQMTAPMVRACLAAGQDQQQEAAAAEWARARLGRMDLITLKVLAELCAC